MIRLAFACFFVLCGVMLSDASLTMDKYPTQGMNLYVSGLCTLGAAACLLIAVLCLLWRQE